MIFKKYENIIRISPFTVQNRKCRYVKQKGIPLWFDYYEITNNPSLSVARHFIEYEDKFVSFVSFELPKKI